MKKIKKWISPILLIIIIFLSINLIFKYTADIVVLTSGATPLLGDSPKHTYVINSFTKTKYKTSKDYEEEHNKKQV